MYTCKYCNDSLRQVLILDSPPHEAFPLQGLVHRRDSRPNQPMDIYATEPVGSWAQIIELLPSVAELYIIFERVRLHDVIFLYHHISK